MTGLQLQALLDALGFDGTPLDVDLAAFHVPYDDRGRTNTEGDLAAAARRAERVALSAPIGAGETSVARFALDAPAAGLAPIWVSVARDGDDVIRDPAGFLRHIIQTILRHAQRAGGLDSAERDELLAAATARVPLAATARRLGGKVGASGASSSLPAVRSGRCSATRRSRRSRASTVDRPPAICAGCSPSRTGRSSPCQRRPRAHRGGRRRRGHHQALRVAVHAAGLVQSMCRAVPPRT